MLIAIKSSPESGLAPRWARWMTTESEKQCSRSEAARIMSVDLASAVDQFGDPDLLSEGKINLIALDAIVERLGERWAHRRDQIYGHVDRTLHRRFGAHGYHVRITETDFLICQPEISRFSGQAACLHALREILTYFIGEGAQADNCVHQVTKISASEIETWRIRASEVEEGEQAERQARAAARSGGRTVDIWTPFVASDGRELQVTCSLEPVLQLRSFSRIGFRIVARVVVAGSNEALTVGAISRLSRADILRIDLATVARGMECLRTAAGGELQPSLIVPVTFTSLSSQRGRAEIAKLLIEARGLVSRGVICEIGDIEGVPQGVILSVTSLVRPYCLFVVARLDVSPPALVTSSRLKRVGVQALSAECPKGLCEGAFRRWARSTIEASRQIAKSTLLYRVASLRQAALAAELGATHASLKDND